MYRLDVIRIYVKLRLVFIFFFHIMPCQMNILNLATHAKLSSFYDAITGTFRIRHSGLPSYKASSTYVFTSLDAINVASSL